MRDGWLTDPSALHLLRRFDTALADVGTPPELPALHAQLFSSKAKRLRPSLLLVCAALGPDPAPAAVQAAVGIELLHEATLYHDDIVDEAPLRRGEKTTQERFGAAIAGLAGAELLFRTGEYFAELSPRLRRQVGRTVEALCRGQLRELELIRFPDLSVRERLRIMRDKTASLFALACRIGATLACVSEADVEQLTRYGRRVGMAYQALDDIVDTVADVDTLGRSAGSDLRDGIYTLPLLLALDSEGPAAAALREHIAPTPDARWSDDTVLACTRLIGDCGGVQSAVRMLAEWLGDARRWVRVSSPQARPEAIESLFQLTLALQADAELVAAGSPRDQDTLARSLRA